MNNNKELELLADLAKLVKRHGSETFANLARQVSDPEFSKQLALLLSATAEVSRTQSKDKPTGTKSASHLDFRASLLELESREPEKTKLLTQLYENLLAKTILTSIREISNFLQDNELPLLKVTSREKAIVPFVKIFIPLSIERVHSLLQKIRPKATSDDRSLEGWSNIILGKQDLSNS